MANQWTRDLADALLQAARRRNGPTARRPRRQPRHAGTPPPSVRRPVAPSEVAGIPNSRSTPRSHLRKEAHDEVQGHDNDAGQGRAVRARAGHGLGREEHRVRGHGRTPRARGSMSSGLSAAGSPGAIARRSLDAREPVERDGFVQRCVIAEWTFNAADGIAPWLVVADYLIARAIIETGIENAGPAPGSDAVGPLRVTSARMERLSWQRRGAGGGLHAGAQASSDRPGGRRGLSHASRRKAAERAWRRRRQGHGKRSLHADPAGGAARVPDR